MVPKTWQVLQHSKAAWQRIGMEGEAEDYRQDHIFLGDCKRVLRTEPRAFILNYISSPHLFFLPALFYFKTGLVKLPRLSLNLWPSSLNFICILPSVLWIGLIQLVKDLTKIVFQGRKDSASKWQHKTTACESRIEDYNIIMRTWIFSLSASPIDFRLVCTKKITKVNFLRAHPFLTLSNVLGIILEALYRCLIH